MPAVHRAVSPHGKFVITLTQLNGTTVHHGSAYQNYFGIFVHIYLASASSLLTNLLTDS